MARTQSLDKGNELEWCIFHAGDRILDLFKGVVSLKFWKGGFQVVAVLLLLRLCLLSNYPLCIRSLFTLLFYFRKLCATSCQRITIRFFKSPLRNASAYNTIEFSWLTSSPRTQLVLWLCPLFIGELPLPHSVVQVKAASLPLSAGQKGTFRFLI